MLSSYWIDIHGREGGLNPWPGPRPIPNDIARTSASGGLELRSTMWRLLDIRLLSRRQIRSTTTTRRMAMKSKI